MKTAKEAYKWVSFAVFSLIIAGVLALIVGLTRTPFLKTLVSKDYFYSSLVGHVVFSMVVWFLTYQIAIWRLCFTDSKSDRFTFPLAILGSVLIALPAVFGMGTPYMNNYVPVIGSPLFYAGLLIFGAAFLFNVFRYLPQAFKNIMSDDNVGQLASVSVIVSFVMMVALLPSLYSASSYESAMKIYFERAFWIPGHMQQFVNACMMLIGWQLLLKIEGVKTKSSKWLKYSNIFFILSIFPLMYGLIVDPLADEVQYAVLYSFGAGIGLPVLVHTVYLLKNFPKKYGSIAVQSLIFSLLVYYTGEIIAYLGLSRSDMRIPAHYHGVLTAATIALMGLTYHIIDNVKGRVYLNRIARIQPAVYGVGMMIVIIGMFIAGTHGASRKAYEFGYSEGSSVFNAMNFMGIGVVISILGGIFFVLYTSVSILKGAAGKSNESS